MKQIKNNLTGRPLMLDEMKRARELYKTGKLSLKQVADIMSQELKKPVYKKSVHRWVTYPVDKKS